MEGCKQIQNLSDSFGSLSSMRTLCIRNCKRVQKLPHSFGSLRHLLIWKLCHDAGKERQAQALLMQSGQVVRAAMDLSEASFDVRLEVSPWQVSYR